MPVLISMLLLAASIADGRAPATLQGRVTDEAGQPIQDARVDHFGEVVVVSLLVPASSEEIRTNDNGEFTVTTAVPAVVIRKPGYVSQRLLINGAATVHVKLERFKPASFCRPPDFVHVKYKQFHDVDYGGVWIWFKTKHGKAGIMSGSGPSYSWGAPGDNDVWTSTEYREVMYESGVIDARGKGADGKYWHTKATFGAAAHYSGIADRETAEILDCLMDTTAPASR